jgi:hypothetical protein
MAVTLTRLINVSRDTDIDVHRIYGARGIKDDDCRMDQRKELAQEHQGLSLTAQHRKAPVCFFKNLFRVVKMVAPGMFAGAICSAL